MIPDDIFLVSVHCYEYTYPKEAFLSEDMATMAVETFNAENQDPKFPDNHYAAYQKIPFHTLGGLE